MNEPSVRSSSGRGGALCIIAFVVASYIPQAEGWQAGATLGQLRQDPASLPVCHSWRTGNQGFAALSELNRSPRMRYRMRPLAGGMIMDVIGPIGPFCPFRSPYTATEIVDSEMDELSYKAGDVGMRFQKVMLGFQSGMLPEKETVGELAEEMGSVNDRWKVLIARFRLADDFQALQLFKLTEARMKGDGVTFDQVQSLMAWQVDSMKAFASGTPPPQPPLDLIQTMSKQGNAPDLAAGFMDAGVSALPFVEGSKALKSEVVQAEFSSLVLEHKNLIHMGGQYGKWDRNGKLIFLDQIEQIEDRWGLFFKRFELMGDVNPEFISQSEKCLKSLQINSAQEFRTLLKSARDSMREDAERL